MKKRNLLLTLILAVLMPWVANAQDLADYTFSTGTDNTQWITLSNGLTSIVSSGDDTYSSLTDIGFSFPFGDGTYTKFWANANGIFSFSSSPNGNYSNQFNSSNLSANQPKICGITRDMGVSSNGGYVKYELTGTAPNRVLVCEFNLQASSGSSGTPTVNFQVQLHENDSKVVLVYGAAASPSSFQIGLSQSTSDVWTINPSTHEATHSTVAVSATYSVWPGENRYYAFERPVIAYPKPTNLQVTGIDHESASFSWTAPEQGPNTLTGYAYQYKKASDTDWPTSWTSGVNASATTLTVHGLETTTSYNFRFKALYGSNESEIVTADFATTAQATAVGDSWSDDFEGASCGWDLINGTLTNKWCWGTAVSNGGTHALYVSQDNGTNNTYTGSNTKIFAAKLLNFTEGKFNFSFDWKCKGENNYDFIRVALVPASQTLTAGTDYSTIGSSSSLPSGWVAVDGGSQLNQPNATTPTWQNKEAAVNVSAGNYYLVLVWRNDTGVYDPAAAVDNVSITRVACPYDVEDLAVATTPAVTETTATVTWTAGEATGWQVAYSTNSNFEGATQENVSSASYNMTNLTANTQYYVKVRAYCGGEDYGSWCNAISFYTECPQYTTIPAEGWTVNFDDMTGTTSGTTNNLPRCWNYINTSSNSTYKGYPVVYNGSSASHSTNNHLRFYSYYGSASSGAADQYAILPQMQNVNGLRMKLYARANSTGSSYSQYDATFHVGIMTDPADFTTFTEVATYTPTTTTYELYTIPFNTYTGEGTYIAIMIDAAVAPSGSYYGFYRSVFIDDITVEEIPSCLEPADLAEVPNTATSNSVTFGWTAVNNETTWKVQYKKSDATNWTTVSDPVTTNPYTLPGLDHSSTYQVRVAAWCTPSNPEGISEYCEPITVHTECEAITTFPINYGFETTEGFPSNASTPTTNQLGACWRNEATVQNGTYATRVWGTSTSYKHGGDQALVLPDKGNSTNFAKTMLVFPPMDFTSANGYTVSFWIYRNGTSSTPEGFKLYASDTDTISTNAVELGHYSRNYAQPYPVAESASGWYKYETEPIMTTGTVYIIFEGQSYYGSATYVDDITIKEVVNVTAYQIVNTVSDPATEMTWDEFADHVNAGHRFTHSTIELKEDIASNNDPITTMVGTSDNPFTGTFDGKGHWINSVDIDVEVVDGAAPFHYISNATIKNLHIMGNVSALAHHAGGLVGYAWSGINTIENCEVGTNLTIDAYGGGIVGHAKSSTLNLIGCYYGGGIENLNPYESSNCGVGALVGWCDGGATLNIHDCFYDAVNGYFGEGSSVYFHPVACKTGNASVTTNIYDCYYNCDDPEADTDGQNNVVTTEGRKAYKVTGAEGITVELPTATIEYSCSGIYGGEGSWTGIKFADDIYGGEGKTLTLALEGAAGYEADHGTLTANGETFTLLMEAYDTEISGIDCPVPYNVAANNVEAQSAQITWTGNSDSYTLQYRNVITEPVEFDETYDFEDNTLQGWTTISNDNDNIAWRIQYSSSTAHESNYYAYATYTASSVGGDANDWLISPQIPLGGTFSFYAKRYSTSYTDQFQVYVSTTGNNISDFTAISEVITPNTTYDKYEYDLSSYTGNGYVAIVYTAPNNQYYVYVDDITYTNHIDGEYGEWQTVNNAVSPQPLSSLTPETTYQVQVKGTCAGVDTDYSDVIEFTTPATCPAPTELAVTDGSVTAHAATITWTENGEATTWTVEYADNADFTGALTETVEDEATYSFDELDGETTYYVRVKAHCGEEDESDYSNVVNFTTEVACPAPTVLTVTAKTSTTATLSWTENGTATDWQICLNDDETNLINVTTNPYTLPNLTAATAYTAKVRANCGGIDGESDWSNTVNFATECEAITITAATPYTQDFEAPVVTTTYGQIGEMPVCWENYPVNVAASAKILAEDVTYNYADEGQVLYFYGSGNNYAVLPEFTNALNTLQISFKYATESDSYGTLTLGFITEADENFNTFEPISPITIYNASSASDDTFVDVDPISLQSLPANATRLVFRWYYSGQWGCNVDDVEVSLRAIPSFTKTIAAVGEENWEGGRGGYYLIASPLDASVSPAEVGMITDEEGSDEFTYDLYSFNQAEDLEWQNYRAFNFNIVGGQGYLYASKYGTTLTFTGDPAISDASSVQLFKTDNTNVDFQGWNLVGNPFTEDAYIEKPFYTLENSDRYTANEAGTAIHAMQGLFVVADEDGEMLTFTTEAPSKSAKLNMNLRSDNKQLDNAILVFGGDQQLGKMTFRANSSKIFMPVEGKDYAITSVEGNVGEVPVNFMAEHNGSYTLSFTSEEVSFSYLHLIDNKTGNDVNLLQTPYYTFDASTSDYESRFRLMFATGSSVNDDNFGFVNASGNFCIFGLEGEATLQVIDVLGHVLSTEQFSGSYEKRLNVAPGVYMIRLIQGNDIKVQKMVVR